MIREQDIRDFEWACSLNPKPHRVSGPDVVRQLRNIASDHPPMMSNEEMRDRHKRIEDRRKGIEPMIG